MINRVFRYHHLLKCVKILLLCLVIWNYKSCVVLVLFFLVGVLLTLCSIVHISWSKELITAHNINGIALEIIKANPGKNLALAPFAFRFPLCKLAAVATGDTKQELMSVLDIKKAEDTKTCFSTVYMDVGRLLESDMTILNMIYVNYTDDIDNQFMSDASSFGVIVSKIGFHYPHAAIAFVNSEFDSKTYKRVNDILEQNDVNSNSSILLVNGMHFKTSWENNFKVQNTKMKAFHSHINKTSEVLLMNGVQQCLYLDDDTGRYKAISLKLANFGVSVMFLLPDISVSIEKLLSKIIHTPGALQNIRKKMKWENVNVFLPRFKIKTCLDWTEYFRQFGLKKTTNSTSTELNAILNKNTANNMYLSKAKQKVFLDMNEKGTHSQNVHDEFDLRNHQESRELPETAYETLQEFLADRPFLFFINMMTMTEVSTEFDVISGVYYGPE